MLNQTSARIFQEEQTQKLTLEQAAQLAHIRLQQKQMEQLDQYAKTFANGFQRGGKRKSENQAKVAKKGGTSSPLPAEVQKIDAGRIPGSIEKDGDKMKIETKTVNSQQRSTDTFRLAEANSPRTQIEIQPGSKQQSPSGQLDQASAKQLLQQSSPRIAMKQSNTQSELVNKARSDDELGAAKNGAAIEPNTPDELRYVDSHAKL